MIASIIDTFDAQLIPYWKLKNPPDYDEMQEAFDKRGVSVRDDGHALDDQRRLYWERRAVELCARSRITKDEVRTAMCGVSHNPTLRDQLKHHLSRAK